MKYDVVLTDNAYAELHSIYAWWSKNRSTEQANKWYNLFSEKIVSLADNPERCPTSSETKHFPYKIYDLYFGIGKRPTHRAVFSIRKEKVVIVAIRHLAQDALHPEDI